MSKNLKISSPTYRKPSNLNGEWHYIGDGKFHDPTLGAKEMKGRWTIDYNAGSGQSYNKFQQNLKNG